MFMYHEDRPFSYIVIVCLIYAFIATIAAFWFQKHQKYRSLVVLLVIPITILFASIPGGILWTVHDMSVGHYLTGRALINYIAWGALTGLKLGWLITALSFPYNLFGVVVSCFLTNYGFNQLEQKSASEKLS